MDVWSVLRPIIVYMVNVPALAAAAYAGLQAIYGPGGLGFADWSAWALPGIALLTLPRLMRRLRPRLRTALSTS